MILPASFVEFIGLFPPPPFDPTLVCTENVEFLPGEVDFNLNGPAGCPERGGGVVARLVSPVIGTVSEPATVTLLGFGFSWRRFRSQTIPGAGPPLRSPPPPTPHPHPPQKFTIWMWTLPNG